MFQILFYVMLFTLADIDECKTNNHTCISGNHCRNTDGYYECFCPHGQSGNGTKAGGCSKGDLITKVAIGKHPSISQIYFKFQFFIYASLVFLVKIELIKNTRVRSLTTERYIDSIVKIFNFKLNFRFTLRLCLVS
jgi:hypothetical protein